MEQIEQLQNQIDDLRSRIDRRFLEDSRVMRLENFTTVPYASQTGSLAVVGGVLKIYDGVTGTWSNVGTSPAYGEMYLAYSGGVNETMNGNDQKITAFDTNGLSSNCTPDHSNDKITIGLAGKYLVNLEVSAYPSGHQPTVSIGVNGTVLEKTRRITHGSFTQQGLDCVTVILDLAVNDYVEAFKKGTSGANYTIYGVYLSVHKIN